MKKLSGDSRGNTLLLPVIILAVLFIGTAVFAVWAFGGRQDFKNNVDSKIATAVASNTQKVQADDAKQNAEAAKNPLKTWQGPDAYGSIKVAYPKTWSGYIDTTASTDRPVDAYFHDDVVPATDSKQPFNLRVQVVSDSYDNELGNYNSLVQSGKVTVAPYALPKVPKVGGSVITGQIVTSNPDIKGALLLLPLRDKTLKIWTESPNYLTDFNTYILPNLTFSP